MEFRRHLLPKNLRQGSGCLELFGSESIDSLPFPILLPKSKTAPRLKFCPEREQSCKHGKFNGGCMCISLSTMAMGGGRDLGDVAYGLKIHLSKFTCVLPWDSTSLGSVTTGVSHLAPGDAQSLLMEIAQFALY